MTAPKYSGRYAIAVRFSVIALTLVFPGISPATPSETSTAEPFSLDGAQAAWSETLLSDTERLLPLDTEIFVDRSPIVDSPDPVKLPVDQQLDQ